MPLSNPSRAVTRLTHIGVAASTVLTASLFVGGCVASPGAPDLYGDSSPFRPTVVAQTSVPDPAGRPVIYRDVHMPLVGRVPVRSEIVLTPRPDGSFQAAVTTGAVNVGSGQVSGAAVRHGSDIVIVQPASADGPGCTLTMSPVHGRAGTMAVTEDTGCHAWHGYGVQFEGTYRRVG